MCRIWFAAKTCAFVGSSYRGRGSRLASPVLFDGSYVIVVHFKKIKKRKNRVYIVVI